jgi:alpha-beta hydrolase superfamily lysophospholipase
VISTTERVTARDGTSLLVRRWPATGEPWAHLLLLHGLGEHSGRYRAVGDWLATAGIEVHAFDHSGFGASDGPRGDVDRWEHFHEDIEDRLVQVRLEAASLPVVLYGHSMGGLIALGYALSERPAPDLLVLSSPALDAEIPAWKRALARLLGHIAPEMRLPNGVDGDALSRDPSVGGAYRTDPLNCSRSSVRLALLGFAEQERVRELAGSLDVPSYVFHGGDDRLVPPAASAVLADVDGAEYVVHPGLRHETHNEPEGEAVIGAVIEWLRARVS